MVKYKIEVPNELSADFWKTLTENFNIVLTKRQHSIDGERINIDIKVINIKMKSCIKLRSVFVWQSLIAAIRFLFLHGVPIMSLYFSCALKKSEIH